MGLPFRVFTKPCGISTPLTGRKGAVNCNDSFGSRRVQVNARGDWPKRRDRWINPEAAGWRPKNKALP